MANLNFAYSSAPTRIVEEIQFGLFSAKESERLAVIDIEYPETMYVDRNKEPICTPSCLNGHDSNVRAGMSNAFDLAKKVRMTLISVRSIATSNARRVKRTWPNVRDTLESSSLLHQSTTTVSWPRSRRSWRLFVTTVARSKHLMLVSSLGSLNFVQC